jgi:hypothetical protein
VLRVDQRQDLWQERLPARVGGERRPPLEPLLEGVVSPEMGVHGELSDLDRERPDEAAEYLLLDRDALLPVEADELGELACVDVVVALFEDHAAILSAEKPRFPPSLVLEVRWTVSPHA